MNSTIRPSIATQIRALPINNNQNKYALNSLILMKSKINNVEHNN